MGRWAFLMIMLAKPALALESWTAKDTALELGFDATLVVDLLQTGRVAAYPSKYEEMNPLLGSHPSHAQIDAYFLAAGVAHFAVARLLPEGWPRTTWQVLSVVLEAGVIATNAHWAQAGAGFALPW
jgi:hypothetical protein